MVSLSAGKADLGIDVAVEKHRRERNLPSLQTFVIDVISSTEANLHAEDAEVLKKTKLSSSFIRQWIAEQQQKEGVATVQ